MKNFSRIAGRSLPLAALCIFLMVPPALAETVVWSSTATSAEWNDPNNWVDEIVPTSADTAVIPGGSSFYPLLADGTVFIGDLIVQAGGSITVTSPAIIEIFGNLNLESGGFFDLNGGIAMLTDSGQILSAGQFVWSGGEVKSMFEGVGFVWENTGEIRISAGGFPLLGNCVFQNENRFILDDVTLTVADMSSTGTASFENGSDGTIEGNGLILFAPSIPISGMPNTRLVNNGTVSPGGDGAIGVLEVIGDFVNNGVFRAKIAAPGGLPAFDSLTVLRDVELDFGGELILDDQFDELAVVALDGDFADGQMFPVLAYETRSGEFNVSVSDPPAGFFFEPVEYGPMDSPGTVSLRLREDSPFPTATIALEEGAPDILDERAGESATLIITLTSPAETDIVVNLAYGGAADPSRYAAPGSVTIPAGEESATFQIVAVDNGTADGPENLIISLAEGTGYLAGEPAEAEIFIDDRPPSVSLSLGGPGTIDEGESTVIVATIDEVRDADVAVYLVFGGTATPPGEEGADYAAEAFVAIPAGSLTGTTILEALRDDLVEGDETAVISIDADRAEGFAPAGDPVEIVIRDVPPPTASIALIGPSVIDELLEESTALAVSLDRPAETDIVVNLAYGGAADPSRYAAPGFVTIPAGEESATFQIVAVDNGTADGPENLIISLAEGTGYLAGEPAEATIFIDDEAGPAVWNGSVDEQWENGDNWERGRPPEPGDDVSIPLDVPRFPVFSGTGAFGTVSVEGDLEIETGASFEAILLLAESGGIANFGNLRLYGGIYAGELHLENGAEIFLAGGTHRFPPPEIGPLTKRSITGQGKVTVGIADSMNPEAISLVNVNNNLILDPGVIFEILSGTVKFGEMPDGEPLTVSGGGLLTIREDIDGGTFPVPEAILFSDLTVEGPMEIAGGTVSGEGDLFAMGPFRWTGGHLDGRLEEFSLSENPRVVIDNAADPGDSFLGSSVGPGPVLKLAGRDMAILGEVSVRNGRLELGRSAKIRIGDGMAGDSDAFFRVENDPDAGMAFALFDPEIGEGSGVYNFGVIAGSGRLAFEGSDSGEPPPAFVNEGVIAPGNGGPGVLLLDIDHYDHFAGEFQVDLLGIPPDEKDRIDITGPVHLGGALSVHLGFPAQSGDEFVVASHGGLSEHLEFSEISLTIGEESRLFEDFFEILYDPWHIRLRYLGEAVAFSTLSLAVSPPGSGVVEAFAVNGEGGGTGFACPETCEQTLLAGTSVSLSAVPADGFGFSGWQNVDSASGAEAYLVMGETDRQVVAAFIDLSPPPPPPPPALPPIADFEAAGFEGSETVEIAPGTELEFRDRSTGDGLFRWAWIVTEDETGAVVFAGSERNPRVAFENPGSHSVRLTVTGSGGSNDRIRTGYVRVAETDAPSPAFSLSPGTEGCVPFAVTLADISQGEISHRLWLVDGEYRDDASPLRLIFDEPGTYEIKLRVIGMDGREYDSEPRILQVMDCPDETDFTFEIEPFPHCRRVRFQAASRETILSQSWSFGDGSGSDQADPTHEYAENGTYPVTLVALLGNGETRTLARTVVIDCAVEPGVIVADFEAGPTSGFVPLTVAFTDKSFAAGGIDGRAWDFTGDGVPDVFDETAPVFVYESAGTYTATLTVTGPDGIASISRVIEARTPPVPSVPGTPRSLAPADGEFLDDPNVVLAGRIPWASGEGDAIETHWWLRAADKRCEFRDYRRSTFGGDVEYRPEGIVPGLRYVWRFGYRDPGTGEMVWTDMRTFTIGTPVNLNGPEIPPGRAVADYRMRTLPAWTVIPDIPGLLDQFVGAYDPRFFRIGGWDPESSQYLEYSDLLEATPGRAFWFLAREGLAPFFAGVPVTRDADVNVNLGFDEVSGRGWNQIAAPNDADYRWGDVELIAFEPADDPEEFVLSFGPVPLSELPADNPYIRPELWRFVEGGYIDMLPGEEAAVMLRGEGYWIEARRDHICLVFRKSAQDDLNAEETLLVRTLRNARRLADAHLGPRAAVAQSGDGPPMPMGSLNDGSGGASGGDGGGGCFIGESMR